MYLLRISCHDKEAVKKPYWFLSQAATQLSTYDDF